MRTSWAPRRLAGSWAEPTAWALTPFLYVVLVAWLSLHGYLDAAVVLVVLAVVALVGLAVWRWRRGHRRWASVLALAAVAVVSLTGWYAYALNAEIADISGINDDQLSVNAGERPEPRQTRAVNILLMGADNPQRLVEKPSVAELLEDGEWDPGAYRSDTMMLVHIPADRKAAYIVSVPRDSYVPIYDAEGQQQDRNKVNESFAAYGPFGTWRTLEQLSGVRIDHMAVIDYAGFNALTRAVGGVDVYVPEDVYDSQQKQEWTRGWHHIEGELALKYVRMRHGLLESDFDRIDRQQNFLRAVLRKTLADGTIGNPWRLKAVLSAISSHLAVDEGWTPGDIRNLALSLRGIDASRVRFMTLPLLRYQDVPGVGSANIIDTQAARLLWQAVLDDKVGPYLKRHPGDELPDEKDVD